MVVNQFAKQLTLALAILSVVWGVFSITNTGHAKQNNNRLVELIESPTGQQIPMADERFRIDYAVDEVTLAFFRNPDTAPVVVTLPDGTKWYASRHPKDQVKWNSGHDYDLINIKKPMPGPWQVSGRIRPNSRVMVVSDIQFHPEAFPPLVFIGENLKLTGQLTQNGKQIEQRDFRSVIRLELFFQSTNNPKYDNFGQPPVRAGEFLDDGRLMDEVPRDGIFTGQFNLEMAAGEYVPRFHVKTPLHERVYEAEPIIVHRTPVRPKVTISNLEGEPHELVFEVDEEFISKDDVVINGRINYPNGERQQVAISTAQGDSLKLIIPSYTFGVFEIRTRLSGTDVHGREFQLTMPHYDFRSQRQREIGLSEVELSAITTAAEEELHQQELKEVLAKRETVQTRILWVVGANLIIVAIWGLFMLLRSNTTPGTKKKKAKKEQLSQKSNEREE